MKNRAIILAATHLFFFAASPGNAQNVQGVAQGRIDNARMLCDSSGGRFSVQGQLVTQVELNGDGRPDYVIDEHALRCAGVPGMLGDQGCNDEGCTIEVLLSDRRLGLVSSGVAEQAQGWRPGRQGVVATVELDRVGSQCAAAYRWTGCTESYAWSGSGLRRIAVRERARSEAQPGPSNPALRWQVATVEGRPTALVPGNGGVPAVAVRCEAGRKIMYLRLDEREYPGPVIAEFIGMSFDRSREPFVRDLMSGLWVTELGARTEDLLTGRDQSLAMSLGGQRVGDLSIAGWSEASRAVLGDCDFRTTGRRPRSSQPSAPPPVGPLGISPGYYVAADYDCDSAQSAFFYDGERVAQIDHGNRWVEPIGRVTRLSGNRFLLEDLDIIVRILPGGRIERTIQDTAGPERYCTSDEIDTRLRG